MIPRDFGLGIGNSGLVGHNRHPDALGFVAAPDA
jgi:hypothetical protein